MDRKDAKSSSQRLLTLIAIVVLAVVLVCSFTACSLFTDAVKGMFSGESFSANDAETDGQSETGNQTGDPGQTGEGAGQTPAQHPGEDPEDHTGEVADPPVEVNSSVVNISSSLVFDKASRTDMVIAATHAKDTIRGLFIHPSFGRKTETRRVYQNSEITCCKKRR